MKIQSTSKILSSILAVALCVSPKLASGQQSNQNNPPAAPSGSATQPQGTTQQQGTTVDPAKAPLQPVTTYPDAPTPQQQNQNASQPAPSTTTTVPAPQTQKPVTEPVGAAAAEGVRTAGGAASKPAGAAIAPAKQHQTRSLFIKIGAIAAGGVAAGTIYALSHGTSPRPPGTTTPGVTQK